MRLLHDNLLAKMPDSEQKRLTFDSSYPFSNLFSDRLYKEYKIPEAQSTSDLTALITIDFTKHPKPTPVKPDDTSPYSHLSSEVGIGMVGDMMVSDTAIDTTPAASLTPAEEIDTKESVTVSCVLIYAENLASMDLTFFDKDEKLTKKIGATAFSGVAVAYSDETIGASYLTVKMKFKSKSDRIIKAMYVGQYIKMPPFDSKPKIGSKYTGSVSTSPDGLIFPRQGVNLRTFSCNFGGIKYDKKDSDSPDGLDRIKGLNGVRQNDTPLWVDFYPERHDAFPPVFVRNTGKFNVEKSSEGLVFDKLKLKFEEVR